MFTKYTYHFPVISQAFLKYSFNKYRCKSTSSKPKNFIYEMRKNIKFYFKCVSLIFRLSMNYKYVNKKQTVELS